MLNSQEQLFFRVICIFAIISLICLCRGYLLIARFCWQCCGFWGGSSRTLWAFSFLIGFALDVINASRLSLSLAESGDATALFVNLYHGSGEPDFL